MVDVSPLLQCYWRPLPEDLMTASHVQAWSSMWTCENKYDTWFETIINTIMIHMNDYHDDIIINVIQQIQKRFPMSPTLSCETVWPFSSRADVHWKTRGWNTRPQVCVQARSLDDSCHLDKPFRGVFWLGVCPRLPRKMTIVPSVWVWL